MDWLDVVVNLKLSNILLFLYVKSVLNIYIFSSHMIAAERYKER